MEVQKKKIPSKTKQEILYQYYSIKTKSIFGYMYGEPLKTILINNGEKILEKDEIIEINKNNLILGKNGDCFIYIWGFPGPDGNIYKFEDYGRTWAFTKEEIKE